jgi:hypothetical protein
MAVSLCQWPVGSHQLANMKIDRAQRRRVLQFVIELFPGVDMADLGTLLAGGRDRLTLLPLFKPRVIIM